MSEPVDRPVGPHQIQLPSPCSRGLRPLSLQQFESTGKKCTSGRYPPSGLPPASHSSQTYRDRALGPHGAQLPSPCSRGMHPLSSQQREPTRNRCTICRSPPSGQPPASHSSQTSHDQNLKFCKSFPLGDLFHNPCHLNLCPALHLNTDWQRAGGGGATAA